MKRIIFLAVTLFAPCTPSIAALPGADSLAGLITSEFDTNSDDIIDAGEWQNGITGAFDKLDTNGDGSIAGTEIDGLKADIGKETGDLAAGLVVAMIRQVVLSLDADGDKLVSRKEYTDRTDGLFAKLDADTNGSLSRTELAELPVKLIGK